MSKTNQIPIGQTTVMPIAEGVTAIEEYIMFQDDVPVSRRILVDSSWIKEGDRVSIGPDLIRVSGENDVPLDSYNLSKFNYLGLASGLIVDKKGLVENILRKNTKLKSTVHKLFGNPLSAFAVVGSTGRLLILI